MWPLKKAVSPGHRGGAPWTRRVILLLSCAVLVATASGLTAVLAVIELHHLYFDRHNLPDLGPFTRFELPTIGHVYDASGSPLIELAREHREIARFEDIPPIVRDAILAAEDKRFYSHDGIDYFSVPRVLRKIRGTMLAGRLVRRGRHDQADGSALFPQGGSTITQQLVRGTFLRSVTVQENSYELRYIGLKARALSSVLGARGVNMLFRKREEMRLSLWLEQEMRGRFGSKRRAKEEILARYASFVYMGKGQYGFARAAEYYFGRRLATFTVDDVDKAAVLAGIAKSPRDYAPSVTDTGMVLRRRNQTLSLMRTSGFISQAVADEARGRALQVVRHDTPQAFGAPAVIEHVLEELKASHADISVEDLLPVGEVMSRDVQTADAHELLEVAFGRLQGHQCLVLPVLQDGRVVGLLTPDNVGEFVMFRGVVVPPPPPAPALSAA